MKGGELSGVEQRMGVLTRFGRRELQWQAGLRSAQVRSACSARLAFSERQLRARGKSGARSIYDNVERMSNIGERASDEAMRLSWRSICLVLALFLFYNPFITICPAVGPDAAIQHHVSYRSTIAASELGCSKLQQHSEISVEPTVALIATLFDAVRPTEVIEPRPTEETVAAPDGIASPLWSRPPPTL